ncbi:NADH dehydrogenase of ubiquinone 1 beta subcomplex subunit 3-B [Spatholobus suberectus]|nr:NADH dehydrogenase of ubiquinone 1 beta subcomplex subunit 3-B [Spatholobus suberectus]
MGSGKHTGEFFRRRDEWRKHPMLTNQLRHATPGLGIALVAFGIYLVGEQVYDRVYANPPSHHNLKIIRYLLCTVGDHTRIHSHHTRKRPHCLSKMVEMFGRIKNCETPPCVTLCFNNNLGIQLTLTSIFESRIS